MTSQSLAVGVVLLVPPPAATSASATRGIECVDAATGEFLGTIHHPSIGGTHLSNIADETRKRMWEFADAAVADFRGHAAGNQRNKQDAGGTPS